jgi:MHS family proline/betaine transporter-like MFS transporter
MSFTKKETLGDVSQTSSFQERTSRASFILSNTLGTFLEYFDATLYAFFATTLALVFFPEKNATIALIQTFGVFAISFFVRPFGALIFGALGDRWGRRNVLAANILLMSLATVGIGVIPSYHLIGPLAPALLILCRLLQGLAISSEFTGSSIYLLETLPSRHGLFSGISTSAGSFGIAAASLLAAIVSRFHWENHWRWAFLFSGVVIGLLGFYLRRKQPESVAFLKAAEAKLLHQRPSLILFKNYRRELLFSTLLSIYLGVALYTIMVYSATYLERLGFSSQNALLISTVTALIEAIASPFFGWLSDRYGLRSILVLATAIMAPLALPLFSFVKVDSLGVTFLIFGCLGFLVAAFDGPLIAYIIRNFDVAVRYTGVSLSYNLGAALFGGLIPALTYSIDKTKTFLFPSFVLMVFALLALSLLLSDRSAD